MSSSEETQLADDLRHLVAGGQFVTDIDAIERRGRRQQQRAVAIRATAGLGVLSLAVAGGLVATQHTSTPHSTASSTTSKAATTPASTAGSTAPVQTVAYVTQKISAALSAPGYLIEDVTDSTSSGAFVIWEDPATGNTMLLEGSGASKVAYWEHDYYQDRVLHWHQTQVNYGPRTWWVYDEHAAGPISGPVPSGPVGGNVMSVAAVKQLLQNPRVKIVGHPVVDGHHTIELSLDMGPVTDVIWADSSTYQVVRTERTFTTLPGSPSNLSNYTWVPSTPAKVNLINHPQIPAGFTQVQADQQR